MLIIGVTSGPNNLDPRVGTDDVSAKAAQVIFNNLMTLDDHLRVVPDLAERLENPEPTRYVVTLRRGVKFHDGHELTSADVVYTFRGFLDPTFISPRKGAYRGVKAVDALDRYTVAFTLKEPFGSFPVNLVMPIVPDGAGPAFRDHPIGTGPYRFVRYTVDDQLELAPFNDYYGGAPRNDGLVLKVVPDDIMRGLELRKGTMDIVVNDLAPDIVYQLQHEPALQVVESPGTDYQYIGLNLRDPILNDQRVRQAIGYAVDRRAIVQHLRRGLATPAVGILPPMSWAFEPDVFVFTHDPAKARALLDEAGYPDPDGDGPLPRLHLTLKVSNLEFNRLQSSVIQQNLRDVGIALEVRTFEFATLYADVLKGNFQMFTLQWVGGAVADPDILRRVFDSRQTPPSGFNRGFFRDPRVDRLLDEAARSTDDDRRRALFGDVQRIVAEEAPYISLWYKTNAAVAQRNLAGIHLLPTADFIFLKDVSRTSTRDTAH
ncbi:MAG: ABC transporter substrate-binding protein [Acidobacteria bacterium]|nr:MAG: ABC transporter substrate-binding protein [Acidobacteriota bacterium]